MSRPPGIPLLSGPPPSNARPTQGACRKCNKEFIVLFSRQRKCMHCGYGYCSTCTDYQALIPRSGRARGYDVAPVCAYCIDMLNTTAASRTQLQALPLAKLTRYINAYNITVKNPIDKNDLVDAAIAARTPQGCLAPINEDYYRKHSVPSYSPTRTSESFDTNRTSSNRDSSNASSNNSSQSNQSFPRPDLNPNRRERSQETPYTTYTPRRAPNVPRTRTTSAPLRPGPARQAGEQADISQPTSSSGAARQPTPRSTSATREHPLSQPASHLPPPPMSTLVTFSRSALSSLSIGTLKQILWDARVRVPPHIVEKEELVERVWAVVEEERRKDNEGIDDADLELNREEEVEPHGHGQSHDHNHWTIDDDSEEMQERGPDVPPSRSATPQPSTSPGAATSTPHSSPQSGPRSHPVSAERSGLCVICQDEEACIAVVDCGHLAMCRECSDLVLASSRECPLCRTRIVTEGRLLRIFKT